MTQELKNCDNRACDRRVIVGVLFCCAACAEANRCGYEIHEHSDSCDLRHAERTKSANEGVGGG